MNKKVLLLGAIIGGVLGAYIPVWLFGVSGFSGWSILGSTVGGIAGIWAAVKFGQYLED